MNNPIPLIKALAKPDQAMVNSAVAVWLEDHPEATTTVEDGSITKAKLYSDLAETVDAADALTASVLTPEIKGAKGDGTTDDSSAFTSLLAAGVKNIVCGKNKTYLLSGAITLDGHKIDLNGSTLKSSATITMADDSEIKNGTIYQTGVTSFSIPAVAVTGANNAIRQVAFEGYGPGVHYVFTRKNSVGTLIELCSFDGNAAIGIHVGGEKCRISQCSFADTVNGSLYSNCIKLSADDSTDTTTPCARNTIIEQCSFGHMNDNCVDCFSGARGLIIRQCTFNNGTASGIEIKTSAMDPEQDVVTGGYSIKGLRDCVNIDVICCTFLGTGYIATVTGTKSESVTDFIPPRNITFRNCIAPNLDSVPLAIGQQVDGIIIDNLMLPGLTTTRMINLYGKNVILRNCNLPRNTVNIYGDALVENSTLYKVGVVDGGAVANIRSIKSVTSTEPLIAVSYGTYVRVEGCDARNAKWLVGLSGAPGLLLILNNYMAKGINNGYAGAGGKVYLMGNIYTSQLAAAGTGIVESVNNYKLS